MCKMTHFGTTLVIFLPPLFQTPQKLTKVDSKTLQFKIVFSTTRRYIDKYYIVL